MNHVKISQANPCVKTWTIKLVQNINSHTEKTYKFFPFCIFSGHECNIARGQFDKCLFVLRQKFISSHTCLRGQSVGNLFGKLKGSDKGLCPLKERQLSANPLLKFARDVLFNF